MRSVLPPARLLVLLASVGLLGRGCDGDMCFLDRWCRLGPRLSSFVFPGGGGEAAAAAQPWNKSLRSCPRFDGVCFGAGERPVGEGSPVSRWDLAVAGFCFVLIGLCLGSSPSTVLPSLEACRGGAVGFVVWWWWMDWCCFLAACRWEASIHGFRSPGGVPDRGAFMEFINCGSLQSQRAMGFLLARELLLSSIFLGHSSDVDGRGRRRWPVCGSNKGPKDFLVFFFLSGSFVQMAVTAVSFCSFLGGSSTVYLFLVLVCFP